MTLKSDSCSRVEIEKIIYLNTLDWELQKANTRYATHSYHPYSAKYIPQIPNYLISNFSEKNDLILDNFMGSGTTLVESKILGRNAIGVDINPLACLISKVKITNLRKSDLKKISMIATSMKEDILAVRGHMNQTNSEHRKRIIIDDSLHPNIPKWFHEDVLCELVVIKKRIYSLENRDIIDFLLVALSSILRSVSNAASGFGNLMINKHIIYKYRIYEKFVFAVNYMINGMLEFNKMSTKSNMKIFNHDSRNLVFINDETVDFICTHPPYMAAVPYAEYQKLSLWWLGFDQYALEKNLIGGQRSRADTPDRFFRGMHTALMEMKRVLVKKKYCCIIIGNPVYHGRVLALNDFIKNEAKDLGFIVLKEISRGKYKSTMGKMKEEFILVLKNE
ncbi:MAG TPA: DNA methyltransferase [Nitrososphaeraceae archaeon]|nr:DNA methyltransferase [Nitrososphaeraceae archaeon]